MLNETDLLNIDRELAKRSLAEFTEMAWPTIDSETYEHNWHMDAMSDHLMACHQGDINRLLINVPPGTSKSSAASVYFPAWLWGPGEMAHARYIGAAHEQGLATRDNRRTRMLIESEWYQRRWPIKITSDQNEKTNFENAKGGFRQSSAVAGMTGKRGHFVTWDDPINPEGAESDVSRATAVRIFKETLTSRLVSPKKSTIIIIMQRLHQNDVAGEILEHDYGYQHLMLPMEFEPIRRCYTVIKPSYIANPKPVQARYDGVHQVWYVEGEPVPPQRAEAIASKPLQTVYNQDPRKEEGELLFDDRFPAEVVKRDKMALGAYAAAGQFQQRPAPREGGMFKRSDFKIVKAIPLGTRFFVRGWDLAASKASTSAYTAGCLMGETPDGSTIIIDVTRGQWTSGIVERRIANTASQDDATYGQVKGSIPQDPGAGGKAWALSIIKACKGHAYTSSPESGDKVTRAEPLASQVENGFVMVLEGAWNKDFFEEIEMFPNSKNKDQVDAATRAFAELVQRRSFEWYVGGESHG